jgi:uracil-DNA glycosylase
MQEAGLLREIQLEESWKSRLSEEFEKDYMLSLRQFLVDQKKNGKTVYPKGGDMFAALDAVPFDKIKVIIIGQDPYHGPGQAHGLCFSVPDGVQTPPSLKNIYKEIESDLGIQKGASGNLSHWAEQGVLLLNSVLSVEAGKAASHQGKGWEQFTDKIIEKLNAERESLVFLLWGSYAHKKGAVIDANKHLVLKSVHPSPLSAHRGYLGCKHFSKTNNYLESQGLKPIEW